MTAKIHIYSDICKEIEEKVIDEGFFYLTRPLLLGFFYLTRPLLLGEAPPLPRPPLLRRGLQPVNRTFCTRKQAHALKGCSWSFTQQSCDYLTHRGAII